MSLESTQSFEQDRNKYIDFRDMLADNSLSPKEVEDLQDRYDEECQEIKSETMWLCDDLLGEVEQYKEMTHMSREQIQKLQILTWIPKSQIDWLRGPTSFAQYQLFTDTISQFSDLWPQALSEKYDEIFETAKAQFNSLSVQDRIDIQSKSWAAADGVFWPNTFQKICESGLDDASLTVFLTGKTWAGDDSEQLIADESDVIITGWAEDDQLVASVWVDVLESELVEPVPEQEEVLETPVTDAAVDISASWNNIDEASDTTQEAAEINPDDLISQLKQQAWDYPNSLIEDLQIALEDIWVDWVFGNESANRILEKHPELTSLEDVFAAEGINTDIDGILSRDGSPEVFRSLYGEYIDTLGANLWLPDGFIEAIVKEETTYGADLNSDTWAKGLMQLTGSVFSDMRWDESVNGRLSRGTALWKVKDYQEVFQKVDLEALLTIEIWESWTVWDKIPSEIIAHIQTIQDSDEMREVQGSIDELYEHLKWDSNAYDHETNLLVWSVYLSFLYTNRNNENIWKTAYNYNWDVNRREGYANDVVNIHLPEILRA